MNRMISPILNFPGCAWLILMWASAASAQALPMHHLNVPQGFSVRVFAELTNPRQLARSDAGTIYAGSRRAGNVYAVIDKNQDHVADEVIEIDTGLSLPSGIAISKGDLYVGAVETIYRYADIEATFRNTPEPEVFYNELPDKRHHGWKYLGFGPDDRLYFNVGAPCNICLEENPWFATIMRMDLKDKQPEVYASGVRNSVGFTWHPETNELWFTDNGRDLMGDDLPPCEINRAPEAGMHFGYPHIHGSDVIDPEFGLANASFEPPVMELGAHTAPLGLVFYEGTMFPEKYRGKILVAEHGSWNRSPEAGHVGYRLTLVDPESGTTETFIDGWLQNNVAWGRPVDLLPLPDGSLLVSDDHGGVIYRISYER
ncbi:MAG: PQQ-dependent sugar dehydrogenase [Pseudomonadales bacterium]|nr:PQQ-dependent sugar dehydrogenase [Pseudomonadales bacterium]MBO7004674.1 PQQ-dependent sugar dehydrogenase [Pseudomonadales bacterium]